MCGDDHDNISGLDFITSGWDDWKPVIWLGLALLLLIFEVCILDRRNPALKKLKLFKR